MDTIIGCTTGSNQEDIRFSELGKCTIPPRFCVSLNYLMLSILVFGNPLLTPNSTIKVVENTNGPQH